MRVAPGPVWIKRGPRAQACALGFDLRIQHDRAVLVIESAPERGVGVVLIAPPSGDADWLAYADAIDAMNRSAPRTSRPVLMQIIRSGTSVPSALVRKRLAELRATIRSDAVNVVVSEAATLRSAQIALDWLRKPHYATSTHADRAAALRHAEGVVGHALPELRELAHRAELRSRTR